MIYIGIMSNERYLCALFMMEWLWRVNQMPLGALSEVRVNSFYFFTFLAKRAHVPRPSSYFIRLHFNIFILFFVTALNVLFHDPLILGFSVQTRRGGGQAMKKICPSASIKQQLEDI